MRFRMLKELLHRRCEHDIVRSELNLLVKPPHARWPLRNLFGHGREPEQGAGTELRSGVVEPKPEPAENHRKRPKNAPKPPQNVRKSQFGGETRTRSRTNPLAKPRTTSGSNQNRPKPHCQQGHNLAQGAGPRPDCQANQSRESFESCAPTCEESKEQVL